MLYCWHWSTSPNLALIINLRQVLNIVEDPAVKWHKPWLLLHGRRHCNGESRHEFLQPLGTSWASRVLNKDPGIGPMPHESAGREYCGGGRASTYLMSKELIRLHGACCMVTVTSSRQLKGWCLSPSRHDIIQPYRVARALTAMQDTRRRHKPISYACQARTSAARSETTQLLSQSP